MSKVRYIMIGGFLGAGKTTAILKIAQRLRDQGNRVGLITNDQSYGLVDTTMLSSHGFAVEEITGGCFCCKFNSLVEAGQKLTESARPDVFIAEPVGSCTDLKATVDYPLRRMYGEDYAIAPFSVMVDPVRAMRILGLEAGKSFSPKVTYIYGKQLEEAEVVVINKIDLVTAEQLEGLRRELEARYPVAAVLAVSARAGTGLEAWIERITGAVPRTSGAMEVDYEVYAEGEALLGWLNCTATVSAEDGFDGNGFLVELAKDVQRQLAAAGVEVAHLKMTLSPQEGQDLAVVNLVRTDSTPELAFRLDGLIEEGQLIVNLRAEADPEKLREIVPESVEAVGRERRVRIDVEHLESFRPGKPSPIHRLGGL